MLGYSLEAPLHSTFHGEIRKQMWILTLIWSYGICFLTEIAKKIWKPFSSRAVIFIISCCVNVGNRIEGRNQEKVH